MIICLSGDQFKGRECDPAQIYNKPHVVLRFPIRLAELYWLSSLQQLLQADRVTLIFFSGTVKTSWFHLSHPFIIKDLSLPCLPVALFFPSI